MQDEEDDKHERTYTQARFLATPLRLWGQLPEGGEKNTQAAMPVDTGAIGGDRSDYTAGNNHDGS